MSDFSGTLFANSYEIKELIGKGNLGTSYKCTNTNIENSKLVIKFLEHEDTRREDKIGKFKEDLMQTLDLKIPHINPIYKLIHDEENTAYVMNEISGESLDTTIKKRLTLSIDEVVDYLLQMATTLNKMHYIDVLHRNLHPKNVFINSNNKIIISDYCLDSISTYDKCTSTKMDADLANYLSPETMFTNKINKYTDMYAFGMLGFRLLTNELPYTYNNLYGLITQLKSANPVSPLIYRDDCPAKLDNLILKCIAKNANKRFADFDEILLELEKIKSHEDNDITFDLDIKMNDPEDNVKDSLFNESDEALKNDYDELDETLKGARVRKVAKTEKIVDKKLRFEEPIQREGRKSFSVQVPAKKEVKKNNDNILYGFAIVFLSAMLFFLLKVTF